MKRDKQGRVRFSHSGLRYMLTESGLTVYPRPLEWDEFLCRKLFGDEEFRTKLVEAFEALDRPFKGVTIMIPRRMRAS